MCHKFVARDSRTNFEDGGRGEESAVLVLVQLHSGRHSTAHSQHGAQHGDDDKGKGDNDAKTK